MNLITYKKINLYLYALYFILQIYNNLTKTTRKSKKSLGYIEKNN